MTARRSDDDLQHFSEVNNWHSSTTADRGILPFLRYNANGDQQGYTGFWLNPGTLTGATTNTTEEDKYCVVQWSVLPSDWWLS